MALKLIRFDISQWDLSLNCQSGIHANVSSSINICYKSTHDANTAFSNVSVNKFRGQKSIELSSQSAPLENLPLKKKKLKYVWLFLVLFCSFVLKFQLLLHSRSVEQYTIVGLSTVCPTSRQTHLGEASAQPWQIRISDGGSCVCN